MKRKKFLLTLLFITSCFYEIQNFYKEPFIFIIGNKELAMEEKRQVLKEAATSIEGLTISDEDFADAAIIALFCESRLDTQAEGGSGSQGINQMTLETRRKLGIPDNILKDNFRKQVTYFVRYMNATNKGHLIKDSVTLHALNFSPSNSDAEIISPVNKGLKNLDINKNNIIEKDDFYLFQEIHVKENKYIEKIFKRHYNNV